MELAARGLTFDVSIGGPEDGPPVLLLHGFPQHRGEWDAVAPLLWAAGLRTIAVDQRGYSPGARPKEVADYRITECALDAVSIVDLLDYRDVHVVGHDWGSMVGWHLALRHADRVRTFTAISVPHPAAMAQALTDDPEQRERSRYMGFFRRVGEAEDLLLENDARRLRAVFAGSGLDEAGVDRFVAPLRRPGALTAALNWYRAMGRDDAAGLGAVEVPTTFIWSDGDVAIGRTAAEACRDHVKGDYRFVELTGLSHWIPDQDPDAVAAAVLARVRA
jgi:pimeloyl-ACP methyl ester carboxylesterase